MSDAKAKNIMWEDKYNILYNKKLKLNVKIKKMSYKISCIEKREKEDLHMSDTTLKMEMEETILEHFKQKKK